MSDKKFILRHASGCVCDSYIRLGTLDDLLDLSVREGNPVIVTAKECTFKWRDLEGCDGAIEVYDSYIE